MDDRRQERLNKGCFDAARENLERCGEIFAAISAQVGALQAGDALRSGRVQ
jgi:hypothetical protein